MRCEFVTTDDPAIVVCRNCERSQRTKSGTNIRRQCSVQPHWQLGSWLAKQFKRAGVKQSKVCGCKKREQKLNRAGNRAYQWFRKLFNRKAV